jgi:DNA-binding protein HU-beta
MNKSDLIDVVAKEAELPKAVAEKAVNAVLGAIKEGSKREGVQLVGFGSFVVTKREARQGRNPKTGEAITIAASKTVKFKPGTDFKEAVQ